MRPSPAADPPQQQILVIAVAINPTKVLELIGSVVVPVPADYTRYR
jgi:hypothetical protein